MCVLCYFEQNAQTNMDEPNLFEPTVSIVSIGWCVRCVSRHSMRQGGVRSRASELTSFYPEAEGLFRASKKLTKAKSSHTGDSQHYTSHKYPKYMYLGSSTNSATTSNSTLCYLRRKRFTSWRIQPEHLNSRQHHRAEKAGHESVYNARLALIGKIPSFIVKSFNERRTQDIAQKRRFPGVRMAKNIAIIGLSPTLGKPLNRSKMFHTC